MDYEEYKRYLNTSHVLINPSSEKWEKKHKKNLNTSHVLINHSGGQCESFRWPFKYISCSY